MVTPNPEMEPGSFKNFAGSIYNIAKNDKFKPKGMTAEKLFNRIFNSSQKQCVKNNNCKWVSGKRIMHREQPWAIASDNADAGVIFYHLALYFTRVFPDVFEIIPLGGTVDFPKPVKGNKIGVLNAVKIKGDWSKLQTQASEQLMKALTSNQFEKILNKHGILKP